MAKRADSKAVKISAKAATQAAQAAVNGSALLASLRVVPAAMPQAPPQVTASRTAATAVPAMASPAAAVPAAAVTPAALVPGQPAFEWRADASPPDVVAELDDDAQLKDQDAGPGVQQVYLKASQRLLNFFLPSPVTQELKGLLEVAARGARAQDSRVARP
jgi:hypothetical protein